MPSVPLNEDLLAIDDADLVFLVQKSNSDAFEVLVKKYSQKLYSMAYRMIGNQQEAEDIVQEAFIKLWTKAYQWQKQKNVQFKTWFYRIVINACLDYSRKKKSDQMPQNFDIALDSSIEEMYDAKLKQQFIEKLLNDLPTNQRIAINLCFYEGLSNKEAAEVMKLNLKALQSLLMRAKENLKKGAKV